MSVSLNTGNGFFYKFKQFGNNVLAKMRIIIALFILVSIIMAISIAIGAMFNTIIGGIIGFAIGAALNFTMFWFSDTLLFKILGAKKVEQQDDLYKKIHPMLIRLAAAAAGLKTVPTLYFIKGPANAFAAGRSHSHSAICVTSGFLSLGLSDDEIEAVLAHEIAHIVNRDTLIKTVAVIVGSAVECIADFHLRYRASMSHSDKKNKKDSNLAMEIFILVACILAPIITFFTKLAISRACETRADCCGAEYSKKPRALISALEKMEESVNPELSRQNNITAGTAALFIVDPLQPAHRLSEKSSKPGFWSRVGELFSTHPSLETRRRCLERIAAEQEANAAIPSSLAPCFGVYPAGIILQDGVAANGPYDQQPKTAAGKAPGLGLR